MARKSPALLPSRQERRGDSWAALGADTSMSSIAVVGIGYDALLDKMVGPAHATMRWFAEDDYFARLKQAHRSCDLVLDVLRQFWILDSENVYIAVEEPWFYGAVKRGDSSYLKQQAEVAGAFKSSVLAFGYANMFEINNSQWHATLRKDGVEFAKVPRGSGLTKTEKAAITLANKFKVKEWAMAAFKLPDLPDLVKSKSGGKIPRPETGYGSNAKAVQPDDTYDAAACCAWMADWVEENAVDR